MAIEVVGQDESASKKVTCNGCGAILKYYANDVKKSTSRSYDGDTDTYYSIECPRCKHYISVKNPGLN